MNAPMTTDPRGLETLKRIRAVATRLYADKPLKGDERRDTAQELHAMLERLESEALFAEDLPKI